MVKNTKILKLVVCMSLIAALAISALSLSVRATFENTHSNTGNQASDIVGIATTQVGYYEGDSGYTKYGDWYGLPYSDWCAMFVSWCANQAGVGTDVFPSFALCSAGADWFISQGQFHYAGSYAPQPGDLIFYASYGNIYHVGLVTGSDGYNVYSIEGNYNEAVYNVSYPLSYGDIMGYATPAYARQLGYTAAPVAEEKYEETEDIVPDIDTEETQELVSDIDTEEVISDIDTEDTEEVVSDVDTDTEDTDEEIVSDIDIEDTDEEVASDVEVNEDTEDAYIDSDDESTTDEDKQDDTDSSTSSVIGDVNGDGTVDSGDALLIQRYLVHVLSEDESFSFINADVDASGEITVQDALMVLEISVNAA